MAKLTLPHGFHLPCKLLPEVLFTSPCTYSHEQKIYYEDKFRKMCEKAVMGNKKLFDEFCDCIYPFCEEIYDAGKEQKFPFPSSGTPNECAISSVGGVVGCIILPLYRNYAKKSISLFEMVCKIINEKKYGQGRCLFISEVLPKTKRTEGIDIKYLLADKHTAAFTVHALLKLHDGRFVKEVIDSDIQARLPKDVWSFWRKKITLYLERYSGITEDRNGGINGVSK
jgi:hypothetical protein